MKIQCDVCEKQRASVFCAADEAALCEECDQRVHHANKLASKHQRLSLQHPSFKDAPLCDICQDRKALLFCREDRAILCRECDIPIHKANEHTQNHSRFLLTGVKLTTPSSTHCPNSSPLSSTSSNPSSKNKRSASVSSHNCDHDVFSQRNLRNNSKHLMGTNTPTTATATTTMMMNYRQNSQEGSNSTSNTISEYLTDTIPGWRLEDLLGSSPSYDHYI
uniref:B box-type domain-containing protein n=2 Tax=Opuntia streptacantha TaxID=393608 RepID=A0A7C8ZHX1_OPUST